MANKSDALIVQAAFALSQGAAGSHISEEACAWFHDRYHRWIEAKSAGDKTPAQIWKEKEGGFLERFKEIGKRAKKASGGQEIDAKLLEKCARSVEKDPKSLCPFCPQS
jgi:hypothetical protein